MSHILSCLFVRLNIQLVIFVIDILIYFVCWRLVEDLVQYAYRSFSNFKIAPSGRGLLEYLI